MSRAVVDPKFLGPESKVCEACGQVFYRDKRCTWAHWGRVRLCSRHCTGKINSARYAARRPDIETKFNEQVDKAGDCWLWLGLKDKDGYGLFPYGGKMHRAHRMALQLAGRPVPRGLMACHHCDNPPCVNPAHLYVGTNEDNTRDKLERGRSAVGERNYGSKLTDAAVIAIRASDEAPTILAAKYGVSHSNIVMIRQRKTWRHIP